MEEDFIIGTARESNNKNIKINFKRDNSGSISGNEMKSVFKSLGIKATSQEIRAVVEQMDIDGIWMDIVYILISVGHSVLAYLTKYSIFGFKINLNALF
jgi:Ca2+-binding EF-hand superfamily protein